MPRTSGPKARHYTSLGQRPRNPCAILSRGLKARYIHSCQPQMTWTAVADPAMWEATPLWRGAERRFVRLGRSSRRFPKAPSPLPLCRRTPSGGRPSYRTQSHPVKPNQGESRRIKLGPSAILHSSFYLLPSQSPPVKAGQAFERGRKAPFPSAAPFWPAGRVFPCL